MRTITDANGVEWTVFEVKRQGGAGDRWTYLPDEFGNGWLCFESNVSKRRLTPVPATWRELGDGELLQLLYQAKPVSRTTISGEDRPAPER